MTSVVPLHSFTALMSQRFKAVDLILPDLSSASVSMSRTNNLKSIRARILLPYSLLYDLKLVALFCQ